MGPPRPSPGRSFGSLGAIRRLRLPLRLAPFLLHKAAIVQEVCGLDYLSSLNPIFIVT